MNCATKMLIAPIATTFLLAKTARTVQNHFFCIIAEVATIVLVPWAIFAKGPA